MGEEVEKLAGKLGLDTTDFKTALGAANRELRVLESGFKASAAALGDWTQDASGLELRVKSLTSQIDIQQAKVAALTAEHQRLVREHGENSRAAQDAEIKLNKETETLNKMQSELSSTESALADMTSGEEEAGDAAETMGEQVEESGSKVETFKSILSGIGGVTKAAITGIVALGTVAIATVASLGGLGINAANTAEYFNDLSTKTSISVETLQEMNYASDILGTSLDTVTGAQARLIRSMATATEQAADYNKNVADAAKSGKSLEDIELGEMAQAFQTLGVSVTDSSGELRDSEAVFADALDALGGIENEAQRDALAMQIFGKSAQELNPLIKAGSDEIARLKQEAREMGAVMSEEDVAAAAAFKDQLDGLKLGFQGVIAQIGLAFIPGLSGIADQAKGYLGELVSIVQGSGGDVGQLAEGLGGLLGKIVTDLAKQAPQLLQVGLGLIQSILSAITTALPTLLPAAIEILNSLVNFIISALPMLIQAGVPLLLTLVQAIITNLPMLIDAALQAIIALANGLTQALPTLIPAVVQAIITIVQTLTSNLPLLIDAALQLILALAQGLITALPVLIAALPQIIDAIVGALYGSMPQILGAAGELIGMLAYGILANIPLVVVALAELLTRLTLTMREWWNEKLPEAGKNFVQGLVNGIKSASGLLYDAITNLINNMLATIYDLLDINSPSGVGIAIGRNFGRSPAIGVQKELAGVERYFAHAFGRMATAAASGMGMSAAPLDQSVTSNIDIFGNVLISGETTPSSLGGVLKARKF